MNHPILGQLNVAVILGLNALTDDLVHSLEQEQGISLISIRRQLDKIERQGRPQKTPMTIFMEQVTAAVQNRNHTVVVTGFPESIEDANFIMRRCPNLITLSREESVGSICIKASGFGYDGMTPSAFKAMIEKVERDTMAVKELLSERGNIPIIYGARPIKDRQDFVRKEILAFHRAHKPTVATPAVAPIQIDTRSLVAV